MLAVATLNVGASALITATVDTGRPLALTLCQTNPITGQWIKRGSALVSGRFASGELVAVKTGSIALSDLDQPGSGSVTHMRPAPLRCCAGIAKTLPKA